MLVISRKEGQRFVINENIIVTVVEVRQNGVRIGITAPKEIPVTRPDEEKPPVA